MTKDQNARVWEIVAKAGVGMLTTHAARGLRARPLEPRPDRANNLIWFVTDVRGTKDDEIRTDREVGLVVISQEDNAYLSITGEARMMRNSVKAEEIWRKTDDVWWPGGPADPNVRVIRFLPHTAELWDGPSSRLVTAFEFAKARLIGAKPLLGENRKVTVPMSRSRH